LPWQPGGSCHGSLVVEVATAALWWWLPQQPCGGYCGSLVVVVATASWWWLLRQPCGCGCHSNLVVEVAAAALWWWLPPLPNIAAASAWYVLALLLFLLLPQRHADVISVAVSVALLFMLSLFF